MILPDTRKLIEAIKSDSTLRVFAFGGSTTAGYPYSVNGTFPKLLEDRLAAAYPRYHVEMVNLGITAVGTHTVLDLMREALPYDPDLPHPPVDMLHGKSETSFTTNQERT